MDHIIKSIEVSIGNETIMPDQWICDKCYYYHTTKPEICSEITNSLSAKKVIQYMMNDYWLDEEKDFIECKKLLEENNAIEIKKKYNEIIKYYFNSDIEEHIRANNLDISDLYDEKQCDSTMFSFKKSYISKPQIIDKVYGDWYHIWNEMAKK